MRSEAVGGAASTLISQYYADMVEQRAPKHLFHLTEASNLDSIRTEGLLSTQTLLERSGADPETQSRVRGWRAKPIRLPDGVLIGDQWCQPPERLRLCLTDGLQPQDWYDRLNSFAYLWPSERAAVRHANTYRGRDQMLLVFDGQALLQTNAPRAYVTTFNVGYAFRRPKLRNMSAFKPWAEWRGAPGRIKEVLVENGVPDAAVHLMEVRRV